MGYLGGIFGASLRGSGRDLGVLEVGSGWGNRGSGGGCRIFFHCKNIKRVTLSLLSQSPFLYFLQRKESPFLCFLQWQKVLDTPPEPPLKRRSPFCDPADADDAGFLRVSGVVRAASNPSQNPPAWWEYDVGGRAGCPPKVPQHLFKELLKIVSLSVCLCV